MHSHQTVRLSAGRHRSPQMGACVMELASMLADEPFSDRPGKTSPVIAALLRTYNDGLDDGRRQDLYPLASLIVGTAGSRAVEQERTSRCLQFAESIGAALPRGRAAIAIATPEASGSWAALAALRTGPSDDVHAHTLGFAHDLATVRRSRRRGRWFCRSEPPRTWAEASSSRGVDGCVRG
jgi:hypothetical protein